MKNLPFRMIPNDQRHLVEDLLNAPSPNEFDRVVADYVFRRLNRAVFSEVAIGLGLLKLAEATQDKQQAGGKCRPRMT
jgi:hypothetical protein